MGRGSSQGIVVATIFGEVNLRGGIMEREGKAVAKGGGRGNAMGDLFEGRGKLNREGGRSAVRAGQVREPDAARSSGR
jgi:hypothetical protein